MRFKLISYQIHYTNPEGKPKISCSSSLFWPLEVEIYNELGMFVMEGEGVDKLICREYNRMIATLERNGHRFDISIEKPELDICGNLIANAKDVDFLLDRPIRFEQFVERLMWNVTKI